MVNLRRLRRGEVSSALSRWIARCGYPSARAVSAMNRQAVEGKKAGKVGQTCQQRSTTQDINMRGPRRQGALKGLKISDVAPNPPSTVTAARLQW